MKPALQLFLLLLIPLAAVSGCSSVSSLRDEAQSLVARGEYEKAAAVYADGSKRYAEDAAFRSAEIRFRSEVTTRMLLSAAELRLKGQLDEAQALLERAQKIDPASDRIRGQLLDVARERRQLSAQKEAEDLIGKGRADLALTLVQDALKDNPRHSVLSALQRRIELEQRAASAGLAGRLADSEPISLEFRDVGIKMLLEVLSRSSGINFIVDKDVRPDQRATVFLRQAKLEDALELIMATNQLAMKVLDPRTALIYPNSPEKARDYQDLVVRAFFLSHADAKQVAATLKSVLRVRDVQVDERLNVVMLREAPDIVRLAERIVALQDVGDAEVLLDVEVLEVQSSRLTELGIKYPDAFSLTALPLAGQTGLTISTLRSIGQDRIGVSVPDVLINLKREIGELNVLANPKIRAKNKEKAKILIGDKVPVFTSSIGSTGFISESVQYVDVGLKVEVEPTVQLNDEVSIKVNLEVSSLVREIRTSTSLAYQIGTRNANTTLNLRDGETQLLAGLISRQDRTSASRIPGLGDLPVLGRLFSTQRDDRQRTEIVLAITPRIVRSVRRPDINETEFWSGSETRARLRPLGFLTAASAKPELGADKPDTEAQSKKASDRANAPAQVSSKVAFEAPETGDVGSTIVVPLVVKTNALLRGALAELEFDTNTFELIEIEEGTFFKQGGVSTNVTRNLSVATGKAAFGVLQNGATGATGSGVVAQLKFKVRGQGKTAIKLTQFNAVPIVGYTAEFSVPVSASIEAK